MRSDLLTSAEAAALLGVSPSSIKRWQEEGLLPCVRTAGHHRRFERSVVERFRIEQASEDPSLVASSAAGEWLDTILATEDSHALEARLLDERARLGSWWRVAEGLGPVIAEIGTRWIDGTLSVVEEHLASERLSRALSRVCERMPVASLAPRALLATAEGEDHTLGLSLVEVTLRELGWRTLWAGRQTPVAELVRTVGSMQPPLRLLAISASAASTNARALAAQAKRISEACRTANVALTLGGGGHWPEVLPHGTRLRTVEGLHTYARDLAASI